MFLLPNSLLSRKLFLIGQLKKCNVWCPLGWLRSSAWFFHAPKYSSGLDRGKEVVRGQNPFAQTFLDFKNNYALILLWKTSSLSFKGWDHFKTTPLLLGRKAMDGRQRKRDIQFLKETMSGYEPLIHSNIIIKNN